MKEECLSSQVQGNLLRLLHLLVDDILSTIDELSDREWTRTEALDLRRLNSATKYVLGEIDARSAKETQAPPVRDK